MDIYEEIVKALRHEERVMLATIISASGSTPAAQFSKMLVRNQGLDAVGTVGGGCLEADVLQWARMLYEKKFTKVLTFHLNEDNAESGLICGGSLDILVEPLEKSNLPLFKQLKNIRERGDDCAFVRSVTSTNSVSRAIVMRDGPFIATGIAPAPQSQISKEAMEALKDGQVKRIPLQGSDEIIIEPIFGMPRLLLFGGGHVSKFASKFAAMVGFRVTVVDDRVLYANKERFPEASEIICDNFGQAIEQLTTHRNTYIAIITRGHKFDEFILERIINSDAKYIGMIGSKRKVLTAYKHLVGKGISQERLSRVYAPLGLDIRAVTAEEIGISIVAELIRVRRSELGFESASDPRRRVDVHHKSEGVFQLLERIEQKRHFEPLSK